MLTVINTIINYFMNTVMSMCPVTNSVLQPVMNRESHLLTTSGLVIHITRLDFSFQLYQVRHDKYQHLYLSNTKVRLAILVWIQQGDILQSCES